MLDNLTKLRKIELELLESFAFVCKEHNLKWYTFFGTLLGMRRCGGFLPWDDDIDVVMPMEDYLILCENKRWFDESKYYLQTPQDYGVCRFAKLRRNGTTAFRDGFIDCLKTEGHQGISIDIIPLSSIPGVDAYHTPTTGSVKKQSAVYLKEWFEPSGIGMFEGVNVRVPANPRKILTECYGDWAWPHGAEEIKPSCWFFDTEVGYEHYIRRYTGMLDNIEGKTIYLFGAADTLRIWLERFDLRKQVVCAFDNSPNKWGKQVFGVEVKNPADLPKMIDGNSRVIIVSLWHQEISGQLEKMGISDFYVYIDDYYDEKIGNKVTRREDFTDGKSVIPKWC